MDLSAVYESSRIMSLGGLVRLDDQTLDDINEVTWLNSVLDNSITLRPDLK